MVLGRRLEEAESLPRFKCPSPDQRLTSDVPPPPPVELGAVLSETAVEPRERPRVPDTPLSEENKTVVSGVSLPRALGIASASEGAAWKELEI